MDHHVQSAYRFIGILSIMLKTTMYIARDSEYHCQILDEFLRILKESLKIFRTPKDSEWIINDFKNILHGV